MAEEEDIDSLKRRGRRRLIGAIALVLLAVIVLPMVFDPEPKTNAADVQIRIPGENESAFNPKGTPPAAANPARPPVANALSEKPAAAPRALADEDRSTDKAASAGAAPKKAAGSQTDKAPVQSNEAAVPAKKPAAAPAAANGGYIVPVAAFSSSEKVKEVASALRSAKLPYYTEPVATAKGPVTRVRAGPFASREAAERAREKLHDLGLKPGNAVAREG